jgi:hypothetical protein
MGADMAAIRGLFSSPAAHAAGHYEVTHTDSTFGMDCFWGDYPTVCVGALAGRIYAGTRIL